MYICTYNRVLFLYIDGGNRNTAEEVWVLIAHATPEQYHTRHQQSAIDYLVSVAVNLDHFQQRFPFVMILGTRVIFIGGLLLTDSMYFFFPTTMNHTVDIAPHAKTRTTAQRSAYFSQHGVLAPAGM